MIKSSYKLNEVPITLDELNRGLEKLIPGFEECIRESVMIKDRELEKAITDMRVTPAAVKGQDVEQQTEKENLQLQGEIQKQS